MKYKSERGALSAICQPHFTSATADVPGQTWEPPGRGSSSERLMFSARDGNLEMFNPWVRRSPGVGNGNPFQFSCLGNFMGREAWHTTVHGVTKSQTQLSTALHQENK